MSGIIPIIMNPTTRKASSGVGKLLLIFGAAGAAVIAFIFIAKKFNPLKMFGNLFGNLGKGVGGFFEKMTRGFKSLFTGGTDKPKTFKELEGAPREAFQSEVAFKYFNIRREFRRYTKLIIRELEILKIAKGVSKDMAGRISIVQSAFRRVDKTFVRDIPKQFEGAFNRKRNILEQNLIASFRKKAIIKVARKVKGYGAKVALMELRLRGMK